MKSYQNVADRYILLLEDLGIKGSESKGVKTSYTHLLWMLYQIRDDSLSSETKSHRWLGFVQGVLCSRELLSVEKERDLTRFVFNGE